MIEWTSASSRGHCLRDTAPHVGGRHDVRFGADCPVRSGLQALRPPPAISAAAQVTAIAARNLPSTLTGKPFPISPLISGDCWAA